MEPFIKERRIICMTLSLGLICLATHLTRLWIKERRTSCLKIGGESSGANCPGGELSGYLSCLRWPPCQSRCVSFVFSCFP